MSDDKRNLETIPKGSLGLIPLASCKELGEKVDHYLVKWREKRQHEHKDTIAFKGYQSNSYIMDVSVPRFGTGVAMCDQGICPRLRSFPSCRRYKLQPDL